MSRGAIRLTAGARAYVAVASALGACLVRLLGATWRLTEIGGDAVAREQKSGRRVLYSFWHCHILPMAYAKRGTDTHVLISWHRDGEIIARLVKRLGIGVVRGSTSRGSARGLADMVHKSSEGYDLAITPDGPRGPAGRVQPGVVHLSASSGAAVVPVGVAADWAKRLSSWDRFMIPLPFSKVRIIYGRPILFDDGVDLDDACERLGDIMKDLTERAGSSPVHCDGERPEDGI